MTDRHTVKSAVGNMDIKVFIPTVLFVLTLTFWDTNLLMKSKKMKYKIPDHDFHIRPGFPHGISRVTINAGAGSVDEGNGNISLDLAYPLQHRSLSPAVGNGHVLKRCFSTVNKGNNIRIRIILIAKYNNFLGTETYWLYPQYILTHKVQGQQNLTYSAN